MGNKLLNVPANTYLFDKGYGKGRLLCEIFYAAGSAGKDYLFPRICCDGAMVMPLDQGIEAWQTIWVGTDTLGICVGKRDTTLHYYTLVVTIPFVFESNFEVGLYNSHATTLYQGRVAWVALFENNDKILRPPSERAGFRLRGEYAY